MLITHPWQNPILLEDDQSFASMGKYILDNGNFKFSNVPEIYSSFRTPGYPLLLSVIFSIFGIELWLIPLIQIIIDLGTVVIVYSIAQELQNDERVSLLAALLYSLSIPSILATQLVMTETFFTFIFSLSLYFMIKAYRNDRILFYVLSSLFLGVSAYIRPIVLYLPFFIAFVILVIEKNKLKKILRSSLYVAVFFIVLVPWQYRNYIYFNHFQMTSQGGYSLCNYNVAIIKAKLYKKTTKEIINGHLKSVSHLSNPFDKSDGLEKIALNFIKENPFEYSKYHVLGIANMFLSTEKAELLKLLGKENSITKYEAGSKSIIDRIRQNLFSPEQLFLTPILVILNSIIYLSAIVGVYFYIKKKNYEKAPIVIILIILIYFVNIIGVVGGMRYKIPLIPLYLILAAIGFIELKNQQIKKI